MKFACFSPLYLKIFEKSPFLMKTPSQNFAHYTEVEKHPFGVKTPNLATLSAIKATADTSVKTLLRHRRSDESPNASIPMCVDMHLKMCMHSLNLFLNNF